MWCVGQLNDDLRCAGDLKFIIYQLALFVRVFEIYKKLLYTNKRLHQSSV